VPTFTHAGQRLSYEIYGEGTRNLVLLPGLLLPSRMHEPLARALAERGHRVIAFDLLGHGGSDRPRDMWRYSMPIFAREVVALLDHLDLDEAVVGGTSLGANTTLEVASLAPSRLRGMVIEMPVLDNALLACAIAFTPLMVALTFGEPVTRPVAAVMRQVPRVFGHYPNIFLDWVSQEPRPSASLLRAHRAAARRTKDVRDTRARARSSARCDSPVLRRQDARRGAAERPPHRSRLDLRAAPEAAPPHERDRLIPRRVLDAAARGPAPPGGQRLA
jgi:pimeloyl-ACP methyl ester carboxylesterase